MNLKAAISASSDQLRKAGIAEPLMEARSLIAIALKRHKSFIYAYPEYELSASELESYLCLVARRAKREPYQHIVGKQEFFGLDFLVSPDVLIPRPETEVLVEETLKILNAVDSPVICEIGIGSGCISIAILKNSPTATSFALDISEFALALAKRNAEQHEVGERLRLIRSDLFKAISDRKFDVIVSNPPYVPLGDLEHLQPEVRDFEPHSALTDGGSGLSIIERIVADSPERLHSGGRLLLEIGFGQAERVREMFRNDLWRSVYFLADLQQIPRTVVAVRK